MAVLSASEMEAVAESKANGSRTYFVIEEYYSSGKWCFVLGGNGEPDHFLGSLADCASSWARWHAAGSLVGTGRYRLTQRFPGLETLVVAEVDAQR